MYSCHTQVFIKCINVCILGRILPSVRNYEVNDVENMEVLTRVSSPLGKNKTNAKEFLNVSYEGKESAKCVSEMHKLELPFILHLLFKRT